MFDLDFITTENNTRRMKNRKTNYRIIPVQFGILFTFALVPLWLRLPVPLPIGADLYVTRFLIFPVIVLTILSWLATGMPGFRDFLADRLRVLWALCLLLFGIWAYTSGAWAFQGSAYPELAASASLQVLAVILFALVVACACPPPRWIIGVLLFGLGWSALLAVTQVTLQSSVGGIFASLGEFPLSVNQRGVSYLTVDGVRWLRPYALLPHPNVLAGFMAVVLLCLTVPLTSKQRRVWIFMLPLLVVGLWAFGLTFSRGGWIGFAAGAFALLPLLARSNRLRGGFWLSLLVAAVIGVIFFLTYRPLILARAGEGAEGVELFSINERALLIEAALDAVNERPLQGVGLANFPWYASYYFFDREIPLRGNNVHHYLLAVWAETGVVGVILITGAMITGIEAALRQIKQSARSRAERAAFLAGFMALVASGLVDHYAWSLIQMQILWWGGLAAALAVDCRQSTDAVLESAV